VEEGDQEGSWEVGSVVGVEEEEGAEETLEKEVEGPQEKAKEWS
jgi:hypothetical protein